MVKTSKQREATILLISDAMHVMLYGGSRSGKTLLLIYAIVIRALKKKSRHLILRLHFNHAKTSIWLDTLPKVLAMACPGLDARWNHSDYYVEFPNGSQVWIGGLDDKDRTEKVLGTEYSTIFFNECSQLSYDSIETGLTRLAEKAGLVNKAYFDCNPPNRKHWAYKVFVLKQDPKSGLPLARPDLYGSLLMNPEDNRENLPEGYIETVLGGLSHRKQQRFRFGQWLDAVEGALWKDEDILHEAYPPNMERIVVAIDPAVTSNKSSDETGIVVAGIAQGRFYVLDDLGGRYSPLAWATKAVEAYRQWGADRVIGEANNGGDMIETTLRQVDPNVAYKSVHATRGKAVRAEPVAALYEQRRGVHCGQFPELEDQMTSWLPGDDGSPDRMDALVWAATELLLAPEEETQHVIVYEDETVISRY
jgi:phage terminase large subunit-like protein